MQNTYCYTRSGFGRRQPTSPTPPSPRLLRSTSGGTPMAACESRTCSKNSLANPKQILNTTRSKSTTRSSRNRSTDGLENVNPSSITNSCMEKNNKKKKASSKDRCIDNHNNRDGFVRFLQRPRSSCSSSTCDNHATSKSITKARSATSSPSAWALSPGRSSPFLVTKPAESPVNEARRVAKSSGGGGGIGGGVSGVLKYFRKSKVSSSVMQEGELHKFRVLQNRLLQYRFANARAEAAMAALKNAAEGKAFGVWVRVIKKRNLLMEKKIEVQKLKHETKLCQIVNPQMLLLNNWSKLEAKNVEAVGRVTRKLSALSVKLPFDDDDVKADVKAIYEAMSEASRVLEGIEATTNKFLPQAERALYMLTEVMSTVELEEECLEELDTIVASVPTLTEREKYVRVHLIQAAEESQRG